MGKLPFVKKNDIESRTAHVDITKQQAIWKLKRLPPVKEKGLL